MTKSQKKKKKQIRKRTLTNRGKSNKTLSLKRSFKIIPTHAKSLPTNLDSLELLKTNSFSPSVNKNLSQLISESPNASIYNCENDEEIQIENKEEDIECVKWDSNKAKEAMLKNIKSKRISFELIIAPKQINSNCWFNCFFMVFFISDKGRKFFRYLRESMIKGILPSKKKIPKNLQKSFFMLNRFIDASLFGYNDSKLFAETMDTNKLIKNISKELKKKWSRYRIYEDSNNPITYYKRITEYLNDNEIKLFEIKNRMPASDDIKRFKKKTNNIPEIIITELNDNIGVEKSKILKLGQYKYKLDSVILRNVFATHFSAYITLNNKLYGFDGSSYSKLIKYNWKSDLNKDVNFILEKKDDNTEPVFNFKNGFQFLFYYRIK